MINFILPTRIPLRVGSKAYPIQLNPYRNWNHFLSNKLKQMYTEHLRGVLTNLPKLEPPIRIEYTLTTKDNRGRDLGNMCYIVDKFFCDALVHYGLIEDDNYFIIPKICFTFNGLNKNIQEPYQIEVTIYDKNDRQFNDQSS